MKQPKKNYRKLLQFHDEEDPLSGMANLFDVGVVFAVALLLALVSHYRLPELLQNSTVTLIKNPGKPTMEIIKKKGTRLEKYRLSTQTKGGEGEKMGVCYRLKNGDVVYVPESK